MEQKNATGVETTDTVTVKWKQSTLVIVINIKV